MIVTSGLAADTVEGEIEEIDGTGVWGGVDVTRNGTELDVATRVFSIMSRVSTRTLAVTALLRRAAGTSAVSCELLTKVASNGVSTPPCDHSTSLCQWPLKNLKLFRAEIVRVTSGLPTMAFAGEIEMFADDGVLEAPDLGGCIRPPPTAGKLPYDEESDSCPRETSEHDFLQPPDISARCGSQLRLAGERPYLFINAGNQRENCNAG